MSYKFQFLLLLISIIAIAESKKLAWIPVSDFKNHVFEPAGFQRISGGNETSGERKPTYIARGPQQEGFVPGIYTPTLGQTRFPPKTNLSHKGEIELLNFPPGSTSWLDVVGIEIPKTWTLIDGGVLAGTDGNPIVWYICRVVIVDELFLGHFLHMRGCCDVYLNEEQTKPLEVNNFEILVDNFFGNILGTKADHVH